MFSFQARYIASCIEEIKVELRQDPTFVKANAVEKLAYVISCNIFFGRISLCL